MRQRPAYRARIRWHRWMPWYEVSRQIGEWQDHNEERAGLPLAALAVAAGALILSLFAPLCTLPIVIAGGLLTAGLLVCRGDEGPRLIAGLRAEGLPGPRTLLRLGARLAVEDARALWDGRPALDAAPMPLLLAATLVDEGDEGEDAGAGGLD